MMRGRFHYGWVIAAVTFVVLLITAGVRATPALFMVPLEQEFGWNRAVISMAVAINIALFGLIGPFAASVMDRYGLRRVVMAALALLAVSVALTTRMQAQWQLTLLWGILVGTGTGVTSIVLAGGRRHALVRRTPRPRRRRALGRECDGTARVSAAPRRRSSPRAAGALPRSTSPAPR